MDRRNVSARLANVINWRRAAGAAATTFSSTDGRWALVSTSLTAVVAGSVAWLALGTVPASNLHAPTPARTLLPYELFEQLAHSTGASYASIDAPLLAGEHEHRGQLNAQGSLDNALAAEEAGDGGNPAPGVETHEITLDRGDTLAGVLTDAGVMQEDANLAVAALAKIFDLRSLRAGQKLQLTFQSTEQVAPQTPTTVDNLALNGFGDEGGDSGAFVEAQSTPAGKLLSVAFSPTFEHDITIARTTDGSFVANDVTKALSAHVHRAGATIDSSLYLAAMQAGIPAEVVVEMIHMFSYKVDFQRDLKPGDSFEVYFDYYYTADGRPAKVGQVSYAVMRLSGREIALYRYQPDPNSPPDYFDAHGQSAKGMLMKTPVDGARITSGFGMRFHPILGYSRMHKGVDFGVPTGTPVMAAGAGTIAFMGVQHGYGNFVLVNHGNGYSTAYAHLSRFAPGLHRGGHVRQGQIVAYSGMTGMATGPHLHYEVRVNNVQVNPATVKVAQGRKLMARDLRDFLVARLRADAQIASTPLESKVADVGQDLRQAKAR